MLEKKKKGYFKAITGQLKKIDQGNAKDNRKEMLNLAVRTKIAPVPPFIDAISDYSVSPSPASRQSYYSRQSFYSLATPSSSVMETTRPKSVTGVFERLLRKTPRGCYIPTPKKGPSHTSCTWPAISATLSGGITMNSVMNLGGKVSPFLKAHLHGRQNAFDASGSLAFSNLLSGELSTDWTDAQLSMTVPADMGEQDGEQEGLCSLPGTLPGSPREKSKQEADDSPKTKDASSNSVSRLPSVIQWALRCLPEHQRPEASTICQVAEDQRISFREALASCLVGTTRCLVLSGLARDAQENSKSLELQQWLIFSDAIAPQMLAAVMVLLHSPNMELNLEGCDVDDLASVPVLSIWTTLRKLSLQGSRRLQTIDGLRRCSNLEWIDLSHCTNLRTVKCLLECPKLQYVNLLGSLDVRLDDVWHLARHVSAQKGFVVWPTASSLWQQIQKNAKPRLPASQVVEDSLRGAQDIMQRVLKQSPIDLQNMEQTMNYAKGLGFSLTDFQQLFLKALKIMTSSPKPDLAWLSKAPATVKLLGMDPSPVAEEVYKIKMRCLLNAEDVAILLSYNQSSSKHKCVRAAAVASWLTIRKKKKTLRASALAISSMQSLGGGPLSKQMKMKKNRENSLSQEEFIEVLSQMEYVPPAGTVQSIFQFIDTLGGGQLTVDDFARLAQNRCSPATVSQLFDFLQEILSSRFGGLEDAAIALFGPELRDRIDLRGFTECLRRDISSGDDELARVYQAFYNRHDRQIGAQEFLRMGSLLGLYGYAQAQHLALEFVAEYGSAKAAWQKADVNNSNSVSWDEFKKMLGEFKVANAQVVALWCILDTSNDGLVARKEWDNIQSLPSRNAVLRDLFELTVSISRKCNGLAAAYNEACKTPENASSLSKKQDEKGLTKIGFEAALQKWNISSRLMEPKVLYCTILDHNKKGIVQNLDPLGFFENELFGEGLSHFRDFLNHKYGSCEDGFAQLLIAAKQLRKGSRGLEK